MCDPGPLGNALRQGALGQDIDDPDAGMRALAQEGLTSFNATALIPHIGLCL